MGYLSFLRKYQTGDQAIREFVPLNRRKIRVSARKEGVEPITDFYDIQFHSLKIPTRASHRFEKRGASRANRNITSILMVLFALAHRLDYS
jgi:hypothetical protein